MVFFSLAWFLVSLVPVSGIYPMNAYMAEHWLYLPSIGFFLILAKGVLGAYENRNFRIQAVCIIIILLVFYSALTIKQNRYWKEPIAFYRTTLRYNPGSLKIHTNLGNAYSALGMYEEAISSYRKALEIDPDYATAHYNLGNAYDALGKREEAIRFYEKAIEIDPLYSKAYNNLGNIYSDSGEEGRAIELYKKAIEINPGYTDAHYNLGNGYKRAGDNKKAIDSYLRALALNPYDAAAHNNLAVMYYDDKLYELAIEHCDKAVRLGLRPHPEFLKELEQHR